MINPVLLRSLAFGLLLGIVGNDPFMLRCGVRRARKGIGDRDVVYLLFPRTAQAGQKLDTASIDRLAGAHLQAFGGIERLKECAESLAP